MNDFHRYKKVIFWCGLFVFVIAVFIFRTLFPASVQHFLNDNALVAVRAWNDTFQGPTHVDISQVIGDDGIASETSSSSLGSLQKNSITIPKNDDDVTSSIQKTISVVGHQSDTEAKVDSSTLFIPSSTLSSIVTSSNSSSSLSSFSSCSFAAIHIASSSYTRKIIFNEIAWMGSVDASNAEWMEIKNISGSDINLFGWQIINASQKIKIIFGSDDHIAAGGILLIGRASTTFTGGVVAQKIYTGDLRNGGDDIALFDSSCGISDSVLASSSGWFAGNNITKQTMERDDDEAGWHTSVNPGGTPGKENSSIPVPKYNLVVAFQGNGSATITSDPQGMTCGVQCSALFPSSTKITLTVHVASDTTLIGWSGSCYGQTQCTSVITGDTYFIVTLKSNLITPTSTNQTVSSSALSDNLQTSSNTASTSISDDSGVLVTSSLDHALIVAIQIAGASSTNDFVKIYNPTSHAIDLSGWKLHKKSQTGTDYSLKQFSNGTSIAPGNYFVWANSVNNFSASMNADVSSAETLAADNSVALMDSSGAVIDAVAWGTGLSQYGEGMSYPDNPIANQVLTRRTRSGLFIDTSNNANDFIIQ